MQEYRIQPLDFSANISPLGISKKAAAAAARRPSELPMLIPIPIAAPCAQPFLKKTTFPPRPSFAATALPI
jgi:hypothetical protein